MLQGMSLRRPFIFGLVILSSVSLVSGQSPAKPPQILNVALKVGDATVAMTGPGECVSADDASIYETPGKMWNIRDAKHQINFTFWRLAKGDEVTLFATSGRTHQVNTLTVGPASNRKGSGKATFEKKGAGATFTVDLVADSGAKITGVIGCSAFGAADANGHP
jgi:hypothetical protein